MIRKLKQLLHTLESRRETLWVPGYSVVPFLADFALNSLVYWGPMLAGRHRTHLDLSLKLDALIPVDGLWVFVYFGSFLFWTVCFVLTAREDRRTAHRLLGGNMIAKLICFAVFMILPTTNTRPDVSGPGLGNFLLRLLYFIDDPVNLFPSMHCYMSWYGARWLGRRRNRTLPGVIAAYVISFLIFYSTMATRQHYILDVISGVAVAEIALWLEPRLDPARVYDRIDRAVMKW